MRTSRSLFLVSSLLFIGMIGAVVLRFYVFNYSRIPQGGMFPSIPMGSLFVSLRNPYQTINDVRLGDVVVFTRELNGNTYKYIWRVVGLPGDLVEVSRDAVLLNGQALKHEHIRKEGDFLIFREWNGDASYEVAYDQTADHAEPPYASSTVPPNHVFVLGDNRNQAQDSTYVGAIPFESIVEKKIF